MANANLLETILDILTGDVARIKLSAKTQPLDKLDAEKLVNFAKLQIALDSHEMRLEEAAKAEELTQKEFEDIRAKAEQIIIARKKI